MTHKHKHNQHPNISLLRQNIITDTMDSFFCCSPFSFISSDETNIDQEPSAACSMWWMLKCDSDSAQINNKQKIPKWWKQIMASIDLLTLNRPLSQVQLSSTRLDSAFDMVQPHSAYSNELWISTPKMHPFNQFNAHRQSQNHIADALSAWKKCLLVVCAVKSGMNHSYKIWKDLWTYGCSSLRGSIDMYSLYT